MSPIHVARPPWWVRFALPLFIDQRCRESFLGDLVEEYDDLTKSGQPVGSPHLWYLKQLVFVLSTSRLSAWLAAAVIALILVTNVLFPLLAIRIPETQIINIVCFGGAGIVWAIAGFIACSQSEEMMDGIYSGSVIAFISMTAAMVTFELVHDFLSGILLLKTGGIASVVQDRILDSSTDRIRATVAPFAFLPAFTLIGACCGSVGSIVAKARLALSRG
jgi:hypothetical protein